jgi:hypothetical protein
MAFRRAWRLPDSSDMHRVQIRATVVLVALLFPTLAPAEHSTQATADQAVALLVDGNIRAASSLHHYPPAYSNRELRDDQFAVYTGLALLIRRFGPVSVVRPNEALRYFYHVGSGGGSAAYWQTIPTNSVTTHVYEVHFESAGEGFIKVDVVTIQHGPGSEVKSIEFGLPTESPGAKQLVVSTMKALLVELGVPLPENFIEQVEESMQSARSVPANNQ